MRRSSGPAAAVPRLRARTAQLVGLPAAVVRAMAALLPAASPAAARTTAGQHLSAHHLLVATIRRTTGGVPHILAHDWMSLGFGYGFAFAQDNICTMANDYVTVEAQRSRYFGPQGVYYQRGAGVITNNLDSDLFFQHIIDSGIVPRLANGLNPQLLALDAGYVRGYNHYLASVGGAKGVPDPTCRGQAWV